MSFVQATLTDASGKSFPILKHGDETWLDHQAGPVPHRVLALSIPKCGTNVLVEVLCCLGLHLIRVHPIVDRLGDWRHFTREDVYKFENEWYEFSFAEFCNWIHPGQAVGTHVHPHEDVVRHIERFKPVFIRRNLRNACVSHMRHVERTRDLLGQAVYEGSPKERMKRYVREQKEFPLWAEAISHWCFQPAVLHLSFEQIMSEGLRAELIKLCAFLDVPFRSEYTHQVHNQLRAGQTVTYTGRLTEADEYWSDEVEGWFVQSGLSTINQRLGYSG